MTQHLLTPRQREAWERDGYFIVRSLFAHDEVGKLLAYARQDSGLQAGAYGRKDSTGLETRLNLWNEAGEDLYGMFSRAPRIVDRMEQLLDGEVYHYHSKMMLKEPFVGGAWEWHQDYGYWYNFGCLYPLLASCLIAVDRATRENGCLQVLSGTHLLGRVEHGKTGDQTGADREHVEAALARHELAYCECEPGDAIFFHCNLLHRSDQNRSPNPRWSLICCFNARRNDPYKDSRHPRYQPLRKTKEDAIRDWQPPVATGA